MKVQHGLMLMEIHDDVNVKHRQNLITNANSTV